MRGDTPTPRCAIDHLVVTAPTLAAGAAYVRRALGVEPGPGGVHARMGTHNLLLRLGDDAYLEVIAPDPSAPAPGRPRWFGLDDKALTTPRLATWVARTSDLRAWPAAVRDGLGAVETMSRGAREWLITIPADGRPPMEGALPALIEWITPREPAATSLPASGCALASLAIHHPIPGDVSRLIATLRLDADARLHVRCGAAGLVAGVDTPSGRRSLGALD